MTPWIVRNASFDDECPQENRFEVLRPDGTWREVIAVDTDDARNAVMEDWALAHSRPDREAGK